MSSEPRHISLQPRRSYVAFCVNTTPTTEIYTLSLHDALPIYIQTGAERMPHDLSHLGFLAGQIGRLITISTTPVIAGDSFEMDAVGALRLSPLRRGLAIDSTVERRRAPTASISKESPARSESG